MKLRINIDVFGRTVRFFFGTFKSFNSWKTGITNRCKDGQFVLFLDYDDVPLDWILDEIHYLLDQYGTGDFHVFKTGKGYHVVNTEKRSFKDTLDLMQRTSADPNFINVPLRYGKRAWTLRVSDKRGKPPIKHIQTVFGVNELEQSRPHNYLLRRLYGVDVRPSKEDGQKHFYKSNYPIQE